MEQQQSYHTILLDISNLFYKAYYANTVLNKNKEDVGGIIALFSMLHAYIKRYQPTNIVAIFDGKDGSARKRKSHGNYKNQRSFSVKSNVFLKGSKEEQQKTAHKNFTWQLSKVYEMLSMMPIISCIEHSHEADETLAYLATKIGIIKDRKTLIISTDKDYHQLITDTCHIYNFKETLTKKDLKNIWGTNNGTNILIARCIVGDVSDNIEGIKGYGLKSIQKYAPFLFETNSIETIDDFYTSLHHTINFLEQEKSSANKTLVQHCRELIKESNREVIDRNYDLMQLHDVKMPSDAILRLQNVVNEPLKFEKEKLLQFFQRENIFIDSKLFESMQVQFSTVQYKKVLQK